MKKRLNSNIIKIIAIIAMTIDHISWLLFPGYSKELLPIIFHILGRISCPIMCYFIAEGFYHTKNINKYTGRLFLFALISHIPYMLMFNEYVNWKSLLPFYRGNLLNQTSVMWSLSWGLVMLRIANSTKINNTFKILLVVLICFITFPSDWSCIASLWILAFGTNKGKFKVQMSWMIFYVTIYAIVYFFAIDKVYGLIQMAVVLVIPILLMYNGKRGSNPHIGKILKWFYYIYYPLHLLILDLIKYL